MRPPESGNYKAVELPEPQNTPCRCFGVVDLGTVDNTYPGREVKRDRKLMVMLELPLLLAVFSDEKGEQPFALFEEFKFSTHPDSNFSKLISNWRNNPLSAEERKTFDPTIMLNKTGLATFRYKVKTPYRNDNIQKHTNQTTNLVLNGIGPLPKVMKESCPPMLNEPIIWDWDEYIEHDTNGNCIRPTGKSFDKEKFSKVFPWLRKKIYTSDEFRMCPTAINIDEETPSAANSSGSQGQQYQQPTQDSGGSVGDDW